MSNALVFMTAAENVLKLARRAAHSRLLLTLIEAVGEGSEDG